MESNEGKIKNKAVGAHCNVPVVITSCIILTLIAIITTLTLLWGNITEIAKINSQQVQGDIKEVEETKVYSIYMMLNELSMLDNTQLAGNKISITPNSELTICYYNAINGEQIEKDEQGNIEVPEEGVKLKIEGIEEGKSYDIAIENKETIEDYEQTFKKATIEIDATQAGELEAYVKDITKEKEGQEETIQGSEENTAIFAYEEENGRIKIKGNKDVEIYYAIIYNDAVGADTTNPEDIDENQWQKYNPETGVEIQKNGKLYSKSKYKDGGYSKVNSLTINNIDKLEPSITVTGTEVKETNDEATVKISMQDTEATQAYGKSEVYGYAITSREEEPADFIPIEDSQTNDEGVLTTAIIEEDEPITAEVEGITKNGKYYAWVSDNAGNTKHQEIQVSGITEEEEKVVAIILKAPEKGNSLIGKEYKTLTQLMADLDTKKITQEDGQVIVQIVADIKNESTKINDKNIVIDLNGYTVEAKLQEPTLKVESGNLTIVDNKYNISDYITAEEKSQELEKYKSKTQGDEPTSCNGTVYNKNYIAIQVEEGATVTLGEDEGVSGTPSTEAPFIKGGLKGVLNLQGTFNFYDGQIQGKVPVEGRITDTPLLYESTLTSIEDGIFKDILQKVSGIEAKIGTTKYTKLEDAIEVANNKIGTSENQVEIDVVTEITKNECVIVDNTKNIVLDLNGFTITTTAQDYVIENSGKLEIIDSTISESEDMSTTKGKIDSSTYYTIYNVAEGNLKIASGTITSSKNSALKNEGITEIEKANVKGLYNDEQGNVTINGANITSGIVNYKQGDITLNSGSFKSYCDNHDEGILTINGGDTQSISNYDNGVITVNGGNINSSLSNNSGETIIDGGTIKGSVTNTNGNLTMKNGEIDTTYTGISNNGAGNVIMLGGEIKGVVSYASQGIYNGSTGNVTMAGGTINFTNSSSTVYGIENMGTGSIKMTGGEINIITTSTAYGIYIAGESGDTTIEGGKITISAGSDSCGLKNNYSSGDITIKGGNISTTTTSTYSSAYGIRNEGTGNIIMEGGNITANIASTYNTSTSNKSYGIYNMEDVDITIHGGSISSSSTSCYSYGIYNKGNGNITIEEGEISSTTTGDSSEAYGICNDTSESIVIIGQKDGSVDNEKVKITGTKYGVFGTIKYYDGTIKGGTEAIVGTVEDSEDGYDILLTKEETEQIVLESKTQDVAYVGDAQDVLYDLETAIDTCENGQKVTLEKDTVITKPLNIGEDKELTLNLNGKNIRVFAPIVNNGNITITDETEESSGKIFGNSQKAIENNGTLKISGGKINITGTSEESKQNVYGIYNNNEGNVTIEKGEILTSTTSIRGQDYAYGIYNKASGKITIKGGDVSASGYNAYGIYNESTGEIIVENGNISAKISTYGYAYGLYNQGVGKIKVKDGSITSKGTYVSCGIYNAGEGNIIVEGGSISANSSLNSTYGINNKSIGNIEIGIKNSEIDTNKPKIESSLYGVYNESSGKIKFYDGRVIGKENQSISGGISDVEEDYNIVKHKHGESGYDDVKEGMECSIPEKVEIALVNSNNTKYTSLKEALQATASSGTDKITILADNIISGSSQSLEISQGKDITIDLAGHTITASNNEAIVNNGTLHITDSTENGKIIGETGTILVNNENATLQVKDVLLTIKAYGEAIKNQGTLEVENSYINIKGSFPYELPDEKSDKIYGIYNTNKATIKDLTIQETTYDGQRTCYGIYNEQELIIEEMDMKGDNSSIKYGIYNKGGNVKIGKEEDHEYSNITIKGKYGIYNEGNGEVTFTSGDIEAREYGIYNQGEGNVTINGGDIDTTSDKETYGIYNEGEGTITITKGYISSEASDYYSYGVYNKGTGQILIQGGIINSQTTSLATQAYGVYNKGEGTINITEGNISLTTDNHNAYGIYNEGTGKVQVTDVTINSYVDSNLYGFYNQAQGNITINKATIEGNYGIYNNSNGTITIQGTVTVDEGYCFESIVYGVYNKAEGQIIMQAGSLSATSDSNSAYGIYNEGTGSITVTEGNITANTTEESSLAYGIYNNSDAVTVIGQKDESVDNTKVNISGTSYGVYFGTIKYYDGTIIGEIEAIVGTINETEDDNEIVLTEEAEKEKAIIGKQQGIAHIGEDTGTTYDSLATAINACQEGNTIVLDKNITITTALNIDENKNVILDLNGKKIRAFAPIINQGQLTITDNASEASGIIYGNGNILNNETNANLTIEKGTIELDTRGEQKAIENKGTLKVLGGQINITELLGALNIYGIYNNSEQTSTIEGLTISLSQEGLINNLYGIYNETGTITIGKEESTEDSSINITGGYGIYNKENGNIMVKNAKINSDNSEVIYNDGGNVTVEKGDISSEGNAIFNRGTLTLGNKDDGNVDMQNPSITGKTYGISNDGTLNFYDGIIKGEEQAISGEVTSWAEGYEVKNYDLARIAILSLPGTFDDSIKVGDTYIDSLSSAVIVISNTTDRTGTIEINSSLININEAITIPTGVDITIALQGNQITYQDTEVAITNNGTLKIIDFEDVSQSSAEITSLIKNENGTVIKNDGTLIIGQEDNANEQSPQIEGNPAISAQSPEIKSGKIVGEYPNNIKAYRTYAMTLNNGDKVLSLDPEITATPTEWTKNNVNANINADIIPTLNLYSRSTLEIPSQVIVHHYIYDSEADTEEGKYTTVELVGAETKTGIVGQEYTTSVSSEVPKNYTCINENPEGASGTYGTENIEVNYYYKLTTPSIEKNIEKIVTLEKNEEGEAVLTREDGEVPYTITYNTTIRNYIGKAIIRIVDTLPAKIDVTRSEIADGEYNEEAKTITWTKEVNIDTFKDGDYTEEIVKEIILVYKDQDVTQNLVNEAKGETITYYPEGHLNKENEELEKEEIKDNVVVRQDYGEEVTTGKVTVRYVDQDTEKDIEKINPDDSTITNYTYEITGNVGEAYETEQKEIPYYVYVTSTENTKGTIKEGTDTVIYYYRKQVFNFSIEKTLAGVTLNGQAVKIKDNKLAKIELKPSEIENTSVVADYKIKVTNEGELAGTVKVVDKLPEGYKGLIVPDYWKENADGTLEAEVELDIGESKELTVTLIWENSEENLGSKSNKAELVGGENVANYEDTNKEDDISEATIVISIKTGETVSIIILIMLTISCIISGYLIFWVAPRKGKESNIKDIRFLNK